MLARSSAASVSCRVSRARELPAQTAASNGFAGGSLDVVCEWLDLPRLVVLDTSRIGDCLLPPQPPRVDGLLLDRVRSEEELHRLRTTLEPLWGAPVLGALGELAPLRAIIDHLPPGSRLSRELCRALGDRLAPCLSWRRLLDIAGRRGGPGVSDGIFSPDSNAARLNVAVAYDEAFHCYFPDTFDLLELNGATIRDFSPLRDERLPGEPDVVYIGCGHPERMARQLAGNLCMLTALRRHACSGGRIYAEGGGAAYLCRQLVGCDGRHFPMVGALPAVARLHRVPSPMRPVELTLSRNIWLGEASERIRGYLNTAWRIEPAGPLVQYADEPQRRLDLVGWQQVIGSRLQLNFAAQPNLLRSLCCSDRPGIVTV